MTACTCLASCRPLLQRNPRAVVVMLEPTVALTFQQAAVFIAAGFMDQGWEVACHNSDHPLDPSSWLAVAGSTRVLVVTARVRRGAAAAVPALSCLLMVTDRLSCSCGSQPITGPASQRASQPAS